MLGPAAHVRVGNGRPAKLLLQRPLKRGHHLFALGALGRHLARQRGVLLRLEEFEGQVFQLRLDARHAEAVGQRRVDFEGLGGNAGPLVGRQVLQRPHVVEPVRQLDDDDPRVLGDREQQLAVVLDLLLRGGAEGQVGNFGQTVDQPGHLGAEFLGHVFGADVGVFHHIVKQRGHDGGGIEELADQDRGHGNAVGDEFLAAHPLLAPVRARAEAERAIDQLEIEPVGVSLQRGPEVGSKVQ